MSSRFLSLPIVLRRPGLPAPANIGGGPGGDAPGGGGPGGNTPGGGVPGGDADEHRGGGDGGGNDHHGGDEHDGGGDPDALSDCSFTSEEVARNQMPCTMPLPIAARSWVLKARERKRKGSQHLPHH